MPTPLRYPGGKQKMWKVLEAFVSENVGGNCHYVEPYAGGAGIAMELLERNVVSGVYLNDINPHVHCFWNAVLKHSEELCEMVINTPITVEEWFHQKKVMRMLQTTDIEKGFAFLFLNRTSFSGIMNGGIIGGRNQTGKYKIDARFSKDRIVAMIKEIAAYRDRIKLTCLDAKDFLGEVVKNVPSPFLYCDPPYYVKGRQLYMDYYKHGNHVEIAEVMHNLENVPWIVTYDNVLEIREMYKGFRQFSFDLAYSARTRQVGKEVMICGHSTRVPECIFAQKDLFQEIVE